MDFFSPHSHGFLRVAVGVPPVALASPARNLEASLKLAHEAAAAGASLLLLPELGLSAYSVEDLFHQQTLLAAVEEAVEGLRQASQDLPAILVAGAPLAFEGRLFNCAVVVHRGEILGLVPKTYLPNYREFYERRQFTPGGLPPRDEVFLHGRPVPFGTDLLFRARDLPALVLHAEICEDLWVPLPPSTLAALAGATVSCNLSASNITIGKAAYRKTLAASQSGRCISAYLYSAAGAGESTTDLAWDGHALIYENGELLAESERFEDGGHLILADVDLDRLLLDRMRMTSFQDCAARHSAQTTAFREVSFDLGPLPAATGLKRRLPRFPYVPPDAAERDERCFEAFQIQVAGLVQRLRATGIQKVVIGVSGGLDSTHALLVAVRALDRLGLPREHILAYTLPGFATSGRTYDNAWVLMRALGVSAQEIDIRPSCRQMLADLDHPFARGEEVFDVTFENVQAGERTSHLFRLANRHGALVVGTGDLSELALGWTTYGVGDQMSHYNVNASVPKTLIQHLIRWVVATGELGAAAEAVLRSILETEISPELVPGADGSRPSQRTEDVVGPYELQDFHLYYLTRFGFRPSKVAFLAWTAWSDVQQGAWPEGYPEARRRAYDLPTIKRWLEVFLRRFFEQSQFKRSAMPNGPKVGSGGSLSPRGDWRAPSDGNAEIWLEELAKAVP
jgi:NAD+ synthase (glutamine-hydrolysing)